MGQQRTRGLDVGQYARRLDVFEYRLRLRDIPKDLAHLLELTHVIELEDQISADHDAPTE